MIVGGKWVYKIPLFRRGRMAKANEYFNYLRNVDMGVENDYTVQVVPKITKTTNFDYSVDGSYHQYKEVEDLTLYFDIEKHEDYFTVAANMDLPDMFRLIYPNKTLTGVPTATDSENIYFTLIVNSVAEANVRIDMKIRGKSA